MGTDPTQRTIRAASYNIHGWRGMDGQHAPARIFQVIDDLNADILALQEVVSPQRIGVTCSLTQLANDHGYHVTFGQTMMRADSRYGNALLSKEEPASVRRHDISFSGREPRGALETRFHLGGITLKVISTHLGLRNKERAIQLDTLLPLLQDDTVDATLVMGDFNDWFAFSTMRRHLKKTFGAQPTPRTFPSSFPLFSLDRIHMSPGRRLASLSAMKTAHTRHASDHLPLLATIDVTP